ncbi:helix-turn-helix transcriptional regulator [Promicromonospora panici]|uniref:helix-turn-helix transcriptional regulator n=1 Tax=Promicromonospora panici TaxID=2219658 RepID=UPI00101D373F|nr:LuxR C-terminal-related transcriptional regulator [Promicromonospora panici]
MTDYRDDLGTHPTDDRIREILLARDLDQVEVLFDLLWYDLPTRFAAETLAVTGELGPEEIERRPRLAHLTMLAHQRQHHATGDPGSRKILKFLSTHGQRYAATLDSFTSSDLVSAGTMAVISTRLRGAYIESERIGAWVDEQLSLQIGSHSLPWARANLAAKPGWLSMQRGLTATLAGNLDSAIGLYHRAYTEAGPAPLAHYAGANAVANLAMLAAYRGHLDLSRRWIAMFDSMGEIPGWIEDLTNVGARIAGALIAIEEGDAKHAARQLVEVGPGTQDIELWPFVAYAQSSYDALFGNPWQGLARLEEVRFMHGEVTSSRGAITAELLLRSEARLLLRAQGGDRVLALAKEHPEVEALAQHVAWVHLLAGNHHHAIKTAARALQRGRLSVTDVVSLNLVLAIAHMREGDDGRARQAFETALQRRSTPAHVRPFLSARPEDVRRLAADVGVPNPLAAAAVAGRNRPMTVPLTHLTPREQVVLEALNNGHTAHEAADALGVSVSTVRTQIRSIYKKLRVSRRPQALARAQELGLLGPPPQRPV